MRKTEGRTPSSARTGGGAGRGGRRPQRRPPVPEATLRGAGPTRAAHTAPTAGHHFHVQGHMDRRRATFPGRAIASQAPSHGPPQTSPASQLHGEASRAGRAWWTPLPVPVPRGRSSPWPLPGSQACWGSPLGSVCFLSLSSESEDSGLRGPHRPSHTCTRLGFRRPNSALPAPTSGSFPGTPA